MHISTALAGACLLAAVSAPLYAQTLPWPYQFQPVKIIAGGYIPGLIAHPTQPELFYLRTDIGGVYRLSVADGDTQWQPLLDFHSPSQYNFNGPESIALDPTDSEKLYIAAGMYAYPNCCAFLVSNDRGRTFETYPAPFEMAANNDGRAAGERLAVNPFKPSELFMGTRFNGLWKSENNAQTWTQVASFPVQSSTDGFGVHWVVFDPNTSGTIYVGSYTTATVYVSTDDGSTWSAVPGQPLTWPASYNVSAGTLPPAPERGLFAADGSLYVTFDDAPGPDYIDYGLVEKYNPQAKTWTNITPPIDAPEQSSSRGGFVGLTQDPSHAGAIAVSTMDRWYPVDTVYLTSNGGSSWTNVGLMTSQNGADGNPYGNYYFNPSVYSLTPYLTFGGTNYPSSPDLSSKFGWWMSALLIDPFNPNLLAYGTGATLYGTSDLSNVLNNTAPDFTVAAKGIEETAVTALISPKSGAHLLSGLGDIGGFEHTDFTRSPAQGMYTNPVATTTNSLDWAGQAPNVIVRTQAPNSTSTTVCNYGAYSLDGGATWQPSPTCPAGVSSSYNGGYLAIDASATTAIWTPGPSTDATQFSTDRGQTWQAVSGLPGGAVVYSDKVTPEVFYAYLNGAFYRATVDTQHAIAAFSEVASGLPLSSNCYGSGCGAVNVDWNRAGSLWLPLGSNGLYHSTDGGNTWTQLTNATYANSIGVGAPAPWTSQDAVFLYGQTSTSSPMAIYRSDDSGNSWTQINDNAHQYGGPTLIQADPRIWGRVYMGMNGRGIIYGGLAGLPALP